MKQSLKNQFKTFYSPIDSKRNIILSVYNLMIEIRENKLP